MTWRLRHTFPCIQRNNTQRAYSRQTESPHRQTCSPRYFWELVTHGANLLPTQTYCCKGNHAAYPQIIESLKHAPYWEIFRTKPSTSAITTLKAEHHWSARPAVLLAVSYRSTSASYKVRDYTYPLHSKIKHTCNFLVSSPPQHRDSW